MTTVLSMLPEHMELDPPEAQSPSPIPMPDDITISLLDGAPGVRTRLSEVREHGVDGVVVGEFEGLVGVPNDAEVGPTAPRGGLRKPDTLDEGCMFHETQERGLGRHEPLSRLLLGEPVETHRKHVSMLVDELMDLPVEVSTVVLRGIRVVHGVIMPADPA